MTQPTPKEEDLPAAREQVDAATSTLSRVLEEDQKLARAAEGGTMMVNDPDRAGVLVAEAGHAIAAARYYLSVAVTIGDETRGGIARCENDVAELRM